ncbi:MAG: hypothetical protein Aurels2KO_47100 [Aureliella sp.]
MITTFGRAVSTAKALALRAVAATLIKRRKQFVVVLVSIVALCGLGVCVVYVKEVSNRLFVVQPKLGRQV